MLDAFTGGSPLVGIREAQLHQLHFRRAIEQVPHEGAAQQIDPVKAMDRIPARLMVDQDGIGERLEMPMKVTVCEIAQVVDNDRVMRMPLEFERDTDPARRSLEFRKLRHRCRSWIAGQGVQKCNQIGLVI